MKYTAVIRTLGTAGQKYQQLLHSLDCQTIQPSEIIVYIAEGYPLPKETIGKERYVYVKKGMVAQRALSYSEVKTEYILFLDDDLYLPADFVQKMYSALVENSGDVISPDIYPNDKRPLLAELMMTLSGRMCARRWDNTWGYKVIATTGYSYNKNPKKDIYISQTNAGACFFCKKEDFLRVHFEEELWMDNMAYPIGEDQVMYYKMHLLGLKVLTLFHSGIEHLDAGSTLMDADKEKRMLEGDCFFKTIFWHRFIQEPERNIITRIWNAICIKYYYAFTFIVSLIKGNREIYKVKRQGVEKAKMFMQSIEYRSLPKIIKI